jgi:spermidine synthase
MSAGERVLFESPSMFEQLTVTERDDGVRTLWFGRDRVQHGDGRPGRVDHFELPCFPVMLAALSQARSVERVLMIGLGAGVVPRFLHACAPESIIDVVEIDPLVVEVAERFFELRQDARLRVHIGDGRQFLAEVRAPYDAIVLDGHGLHGVVPHLGTREFLAQVHAGLQPDGVVVANVWGRTASLDYERTIATYLDSFASVHVLEVEGFENDVLLACPRARALTHETVVVRARAFSIEHSLPLDLGDHVLGCQDAAQLGIRASVLHDP